MGRRRIGPKMEAARRFVEAHPGRYAIETAQAVAPEYKPTFGYKVIQRALAAGIIRAESEGFRYRLYPVDREK